MGLNDLRLTPHQLASLYPDVLLETTATPVPAPPPVPFLGSNARGILIVVSSAEHPYLSDASLAFLTNVLAACKLSLADVAIVNWMNRGERSGTALQQELGARQVLLFDLVPEAFGLPMTFPHFQIQAFNKSTYMWAPSLSAIEADKPLKTALWNSLKTLFGI